MCALPSSKTTVVLLQGAASKNVWILNLLMQLCQICSGYCTRRKRWVVWRPPSNILTKEHRYGVCKLLNRRKTGVNGFFPDPETDAPSAFWKSIGRLWSPQNCGEDCHVDFCVSSTVKMLSILGEQKLFSNEKYITSLTSLCHMLIWERQFTLKCKNA